MSAYLPLLGTIIAGLFAALTPQIQELVTSHPAIAALLGTIVAAIAHFLPSPVAPPRKP